jgi:hypothetical protein
MLHRMKILNVSNTIDPVTGGGEAERSFQMSKALAQSGADCQVLTIDTGLDCTTLSFQEILCSPLFFQSDQCRRARG